MRYSIIVAFNNNYALMSNFLESLLCNVDQTERERILFSDGCKDCETLEYLKKIKGELQLAIAIRLKYIFENSHKIKKRGLAAGKKPGSQPSNACYESSSHE